MVTILIFQIPGQVFAIQTEVAIGILVDSAQVYMQVYAIISVNFHPYLQELILTEV